MPEKQNDETRRYHHGNLHAALVSLGIEQLKETGAASLSLRELALRAGVSPMAPTHHFGSRRGLLAAIAAEGFRRLCRFRDDFMQASPAPNRDIFAHVRAYIAFAAANPSLFRLMFGPEFAEKKEFPELAAAAAQGYARFNDSVNRYFLLAGKSPPRGATVAVWAVTHGFAMLIMAQQRAPDAALQPEDMVEKTLALVLEGLASSGNAF
jgi:AcrR family transcriptional regulator